jgi:hypothetical protein
MAPMIAQGPARRLRKEDCSSWQQGEQHHKLLVRGFTFAFSHARLSIAVLEVGILIGCYFTEYVGELGSLHGWS